MAQEKVAPEVARSDFERLCKARRLHTEPQGDWADSDRTVFEYVRDVICEAHCYKVTKNVAFARALAFHDDPADPIAAAAGSFMRIERRRRKEQP